MAIEAIRGNKVRAGLTIAGVAIGVFVVVAMGAVVNGIRSSFQSDLEQIGATSFFVQRRSNGISGCDGTDEKCPDRRNPPISFEEWNLIKRLPGVETVIATLGGSANFAYKNSRVDNVGYDAYSVDWPKVNASDIAPGRNFTRTEDAAGSPVVLVNDTLKAQLFGQSEAIGKQITLNGQSFTVIGVYSPKAGFLRSLEGKGPDTPRAIIPLQTAVRQLQAFRSGLQLTVRPLPTARQDEVMDEVTAMIRSRRGLKPGDRDNFYLVEQDRLLDTFNQLFGAIFAVGLALSAVAADRPNILWFVVDDMSANFSCYGEKAVATPNVDRLAREGIRFSRAYVTAPVCSPCRSALVTGMYQTTIGAHHHRSGRGELKINLPPEVTPTPKLFQQAGYFTCIGSGLP
ncbi:MAG: hypothetical protein EBV77_05830, partial [Gemmatimonadaceae bacterium]|nr:hypothetical protein [Gemmatimonadaceae bacterium]